ncbi:hypothetical protein BCR35DRAFT_73363 [Leucosporidium creatinivorum]|uniref:Zn(2)-C6 fungal-type domain-containing protein n=1 Tax=Leucosporidium creatinivorum TaxID=106004 RepID=A0A1Y2G2R9_9BASI|nr:hypothetical protein BCR35DRAFT_73363 [Leucosporidium creatinivorum]
MAEAPDAAAPKPKRAKRTYRACLPCRSRKLKCDLGDPDAPSEGPCRRCRRESRDCVFTARPGRTFTRTDPEASSSSAHLQSQPLPVVSSQQYRPHYPPPPAAGSQWGAQDLYSPNNPSLSRPLPPTFPEGPHANPYYPPPPLLHQPPPQMPPSMPSFHRANSGSIPTITPAKHAREEYPASDDDDDDARDEEDGEGSGAAADGHEGGASGSKGGAAGDSDVLLSSTLHNPSDALRLLATASSMRSSAPAPSQGIHAKAPSTHETPQSTGATGDTPGEHHVEGGWALWTPVVEGLLTQPEAEVLFSFFETDMAPLYPLLPPEIFSPAHLPVLTTTESILCCAMITIAARYSSVLPRARSNQIHLVCANFFRQLLIYLHEGAPAYRHISSVEALLLMTEWPAIPLVYGGKGPEVKDEVEHEVTELLKASTQYDSMSWTYIGCAVRLAQELGIDNAALYGLDKKNDTPASWQTGRILSTWLYCYNADRHVSVRLGRGAVIQAYMSSAWWEQVTGRASLDVQRRGLKELWAERTLPQGLMAALLGTIQDRLYPNKEITRSLLRTGLWESFIRSLDHELRSMAGKTRNVLKQGNVESTLLQIEIDYVRLYGNAIALRALQERLRRRVKVNDLLFVTPSLLNLQEGPWIIDSLAAAQSILHQTVSFLEPKGYLRLCPSRIFQRILFAATFLFKALAVGVIEHSQNKTVVLLEQAISALHYASVDSHHIARGFSALLTRLQAHCTPAILADKGSIDPSGAQAGPSQLPSRNVSESPVVGNPTQLPTANTTAEQPSNVGASTSAAPAPQAPFPPPTSSDFSFGALANGGAAAAAVAHGADSINLNGTTSSAADTFGFELPWEWDPTAGSMAVGKEQDLLFQSLWSNQTMDVGTGSNPLLNLFGTLVSDEFGLDG